MTQDSPLLFKELFSDSQIYDLDRTARRRTAFRSFRELLESPDPEYRPSIYCDTDDRFQLAQAYDKFMESTGDKRRAFRGGTPLPGKKNRIYTELAPDQWSVVIPGESVRLTGKLNSVPYNFNFYDGDVIDVNGRRYMVTSISSDNLLLRMDKSSMLVLRAKIPEFNKIVIDERLYVP